MARLSVVVPNYNRALLVGETLTNLLSQTRPPDELIVVDDGSTDGSADVIAGFGKAVTLLRQANAGPAVARNRGFAASSGDFIQFFDSDDLCSLDKLETQERALAAGDAPFAYGPWLQAKLGDGVAEYAEPPLQQHRLPPSRPALSWYLRGWVTVFQTCLFRRAVLERVGPYREDLMPSEDSELLFRILAAGGEPVHVPGALVLYRLHASQQISRGGMAAQRRARDWAHYVAIVAAQLDAMTGVDARDRRYWQWVEHDAAVTLGELAEDAPPPPELSGLAQAEKAALRKIRRWRAGLSRRLGTSSFARPYQGGELTAEQRERLVAIGYRPRKVPAGELEGA
jgi:GT2 family glycosyltransferase